MKLIVLLINLVFISCSGLPERQIASFDDILIMGEVAPEKSSLSLFSDEIHAHDDGHHFKMVLRNLEKEFVDIDSTDLKVTHKQKKIDFKLERLSLGNYTILVEGDDLDLEKLVFSVQSKTLNSKVVKKQKPSRTFSRLSIVEKDENELILELVLLDKSGSAVGSTETPEIFVEGQANIELIGEVKKGTWKYKITYPDFNQVFYFSAKANGVSLYRMLRHQYVHKEE